MTDNQQRSHPSRRRDRYHVIDPVVVRESRVARRLSIAVLGDLLGVSAGAIDHLEHGGEQNHLTVAFVAELARFLGLTVAELLAPIAETPGGAGDLVDPEDPATVGRILSEVGTVLLDDLAGGLQWSLGRTLYALSTLEERLRPVGQRLSWLADSQVAIVPAPGPAVTVQAVTRRTATAWGLNVDDTAHLSWIAAKGGHRSAGQEVNPIVVAKLKAAGLVTESVVHGPRAKRDEKGEEQLRFTDEARFALCLEE
jgi:transcriptional regulator with XRE-family HTH domain